MRNIDEMAVKAVTDERTFSDLVESQRRFLINCAFKVTKRYITDNDDEWSITLIAFSEAVKSYDLEKGSFLHYAETNINRRLIDYHRTEQKHSPEYSVNPSVFETEPEENDEELQMKIEIAKKLTFNTESSIKDEIEAANIEIKKFGFSFHDVADSSPKSTKTKAACKKAVLYILDNKEIMGDIYDTKQLPIKIIQKNTDLPRKLIEHHRKYIIAAMEILSGEYPHLAEYVSYIRKGGH